MATAKQINQAPTRLIATCVFGTALAVVGTTTSGFNTTGTPGVSVDGRAFALTAQTSTVLAALLGSDLPNITLNGASSANPYLQPSGLAGFYVQPASTTVYYVVGVNQSGTWKVVQGTYDGQQVAPTGYTVLGKSEIPDVPAGFAPVFVIKVLSGGAAFTVGTTALTGISTFLNVSVLPILSTF